VAADQHLLVAVGRARQPCAHRRAGHTREISSGKFLPAYQPSAATENERNEIWIEHEGETIVCRQVVGILARRIVCRVAPGTLIETGQRFGIMRFGSRTDLFLPPTAVALVRVTDQVKGGETVVARLPAT